MIFYSFIISNNHPRILKVNNERITGKKQTIQVLFLGFPGGLICFQYRSYRKRNGCINASDFVHFHSHSRKNNFNLQSNGRVILLRSPCCLVGRASRLNQLSYFSKLPDCKTSNRFSLCIYQQV